MDTLCLEGPVRMSFAFWFANVLIYCCNNGTQAALALKASLVPDKTGQRRRKWLAFIIIGLVWPVEKIYQEYRRRFGIGLILLNVWVLLRWEFARLLARSPYRVDEPLFRFHHYTRLLIRSIEKIYGTIAMIPTHKLPQSVIY
jgi:hypothetical protein